MTPRSPTPCALPGCPNLTTHRYCAETHAHLRPQPWATSTRKTKRASTGWAEQASNRRVMARDHGICHWCGHPGADRVDHIVALSEGGPDTDANKAPIHQKCHDRKTGQEAARGRRRRRP